MSHDHGDHWTSIQSKIPSTSEWKCAPGYKIFVGNKGTVRVDVPVDWIVLPGEHTVRFLDREPPHDRCSIQITTNELPEGVDWSSLPHKKLLERIAFAEQGDRKLVKKGKIQDAGRAGIAILWTETKVLDLNQRREAASRLAIGRAGGTQVFLMLDFWPEDRARLDPIWNEALHTMQIGVLVDDPAFYARIQSSS
jgi:hypothetical protein